MNQYFLEFVIQEIVNRLNKIFLFHNEVSFYVTWNIETSVLFQKNAENQNKLFTKNSVNFIITFLQQKDKQKHAISSYLMEMKWFSNTFYIVGDVIKIFWRA